jgi:DEAD/DEAH box helicase domain-containing protein
MDGAAALGYRDPNGSLTPMQTPDHDESAAPAAGGERRKRAGNAAREGVLGIVRALQADPEIAPCFEAWRTLPPRAGRAEPLPAGLHPALVKLFRARGLDRLHSHQARAIELALAGRDVLIATPTASGKTLAYTVPVLQALLESDGAARALWMFPTKALSQDQSASFNALLGELDRGWHSYTYDGDTPPSVRRTLRDRGHVVLTNPWMLHAGILPNHGKWASLFRDLRYVVIDEVHTLSGVFGSSVANVLRRLVRLARHYGGDPRFLLSSATLRDPAGHARRLLGRDVAVVDEDGSPGGERRFGLYNPPVLDPVAGMRANALEEARRLARHVVGPGHQTIFFCNRRTSVEVLTRYLKEAAPELGLKPDEIRGYRGGYLPLLRREIEAGLRDGSVRVVVSTNALELGVDIGRLDVCVLVGYPGSQAAFWQRIGRVGRRGGPSLAVMIARSDPIDQYLAHHPEHLLGAAKEELGLDADNLVILSEQLKCAAFELPFRGKGLGEFASSPHVAGILDYLAEESRILHKKGDTWYWMADTYPAQDVTLFGNEPDNVLVFDADTDKAIGEVDREASIATVHEGAIYQVQGETWKVERFDYENRRAYARAVKSDYFTEAETDTEVRVLRLEEKLARARPAAEEGDAEDCAVYRGEVHVTTVATMYKKIRFYTRESVGAEDIHLPPEELDTEAFSLVVSSGTALALGLAQGNRAAGWRGVGRLVRRVAPLFLRCQPSDLGLSTEIRSRHFGLPAIHLYDRAMGGVGLSGALFRDHRAVLGAALDVVRECGCAQGCPGCVGTIEEVGAEGKSTALRVLLHLVEGDVLSPAPLADEAG